MKFATKLALVLAVTALLVPVAALADTIDICGTGSLGSFEGTLTYDATSSTEATLTVSLTNTSAAANGGFITGFVFNNPNDLITGVSLDAGGTSFELLGTGTNDVSGVPYGQFDFGAALGGDFEGGGNPNDGIAVGDSATFTFTFSGTNLDTLTASSFLNEFSTGQQQSAAFLVRFRGFNDGGSDKVVGEQCGTPPVPEPATMLMMGSGLTGLAGVLRRKVRK